MAKIQQITANHENPMAEASYGERTVEKISLGMRDQKGREIGIEVIRRETSFALTDKSYGFRYPAGDYFTAFVNVTRNGVDFGASQSSAHFATLADREAYIAKRIADTRKRYAKMFAASTGEGN